MSFYRTAPDERRELDETPERDRLVCDGELVAACLEWEWEDASTPGWGYVMGQFLCPRCLASRAVVQAGLARDARRDER